MATNKIIFGNQTLIDLTGDTADVSDVVQGKTFHSADGTQKTGTKVDVTPTSIEPSLSAPAMTANNVYKPTVDGHAIRNYTIVNPSDDDSGSYFPSGFVRMSSSGYAYKNKPSGGEIDEVNLLSRELLSPNPYTYALSKAYKAIILDISRTTDSAAGNPTLEISDGVSTVSGIIIAKNSSQTVYLLNSPVGTLTINRTSGATGQNALLTINLIGIT